MKPVDDPANASAKGAATRILDAFYLEGRVLTEEEYAPLRAALRRPTVLLLGCPDGKGRSAAVTEFLRRHDATSYWRTDTMTSARGALSRRATGTEPAPPGPILLRI